MNNTMALLNITLNQDKLLAFFRNNTRELSKSFTQTALTPFLKAESAARLDAELYEWTEERSGRRNGFPQAVRLLPK